MKKIQPIDMISASKKQELFLLLFILFVTFLVYLPSLSYNFYTDLDDGKLIINNPIVTEFPNNVKAVFTEFVYGLYHPVTTLSFIIDYKIWGNNAFGFRLHNLLLHLLNTILVFLFVTKLTNKSFIAILTSAVFVLHPLHIESVIWISERKDVLFTFWFLLAGLSYLNYNQKNMRYWLIATYIFFILSLLSKATAVVFPVIIVIIDYFNDHKFSVKKILYKSPLFILSIVFGVVNIMAQNSIDFIQPIAYNYNLVQLITIPVYSFTYYISHFFAPIGLAAKHLYPRVIDGQIDAIYYLGWIWIVALLILVYKNRANRLFIFGTLFYIVTIALTLKIIPTGNDIVSERYSYVPYIGLSVAFGSLINPYLIDKPKGKLFITIVLSIILSVLSFKQTRYWKNEVGIWTRVVETEPELPLAYYERAAAYRNNKQYANAITDYNMAIKYSPEFYLAYIHRGLCYYFEKNNKKALEDFNYAIKLKPHRPEGYYNRGNLYLKNHSFESSLTDFEKSIEFKIHISDVWFYKGIAEKNLGKFDDAIYSFTKNLKLNPNNTKSNIEIADCYYAIKDFNNAEVIFRNILNTNGANIQIAYKLANTLARQKKYTEAIEFYNIVINNKPNFGGAYLNRGNAYFFSNNSELACSDWQKAIENGTERAQQMIETYCK